MDDQKLLMDEIEERLDAVLWKIEQLLEPDEISLIRWACGKSSYSNKENQNVNFNDSI
jgi:hypothetical protein